MEVTYKNFSNFCQLSAEQWQFFSFLTKNEGINYILRDGNLFGLHDLF